MASRMHIPLCACSPTCTWWTAYAESVISRTPNATWASLGLYVVGECNGVIGMFLQRGSLLAFKGSDPKAISNIHRAKFSLLDADFFLLASPTRDDQFRIAVPSHL